MAIFDQSGQHVGVQVNTDAVVTSDLRVILRQLDRLIIGVTYGTTSERRLSVLRHLQRAYLEVSDAIDAGE